MIAAWKKCVLSCCHKELPGLVFQNSVLLAVFLLQESVPPVMAFHLGSLGFLSPFEFLDYQEKVDDVLQGLLSRHALSLLSFAHLPNADQFAECRYHATAVKL